VPVIFSVLCIEGKCYFGEGALRVPAVAWWPGTISPGQVSSGVMSLMDLFPTILDIASVPRHAVDRPLDGHGRVNNLLGSPLVAETDAVDVLYFYCQQYLIAARVGPYKVYFRESLFQSEARRRQWCSEGFPLRNFMMKSCPDAPLHPWLVYNVETDPGESWPLSVDRLGSDVVSMLASKLGDVSAAEFRAPLLTAENLRDNLSPCCNPPYCFCTS